MTLGDERMIEKLAALPPEEVEIEWSNRLSSGAGSRRGPARRVLTVAPQPDPRLRRPLGRAMMRITRAGRRLPRQGGLV